MNRPVEKVRKVGTTRVEKQDNLNRRRLYEQRISFASARFFLQLHKVGTYQNTTSSCDTIRWRRRSQNDGLHSWEKVLSLYARVCPRLILFDDTSFKTDEQVKEPPFSDGVTIVSMFDHYEIIRHLTFFLLCRTSEVPCDEPLNFHCGMLRPCIAEEKTTD